MFDYDLDKLLKPLSTLSNCARQEIEAIASAEGIDDVDGLTKAVLFAASAKSFMSAPYDDREIREKLQSMIEPIDLILRVLPDRGVVDRISYAGTAITEDDGEDNMFGWLIHLASESHDPATRAMFEECEFELQGTRDPEMFTTPPTFAGLLTLLTDLSGAIERALADQVVARGPKPNSLARMISAFVGMVCRDFAIEVSSYGEGSFMRLLRIAFESSGEQFGPEAHRRHGLYEIKRMESSGKETLARADKS